MISHVFFLENKIDGAIVLYLYGLSYDTEKDFDFI